MPVNIPAGLIPLLCLTLQPGAGIHRSVGIQQDPFPCKTDSLQQADGFLRLRKRKAGPPFETFPKFKAVFPCPE